MRENLTPGGRAVAAAANRRPQSPRAIANLHQLALARQFQAEQDERDERADTRSLSEALVAEFGNRTAGPVR